MSGMAGNPHADDVRMYAEEATLLASWGMDDRAILASLATAHATMALAYEQRTRALQAERSWATGEGDTDRIQNLDQKIQARIGDAK